MYELLRELLFRIDGFPAFFDAKAYIYTHPNGEITLHGLCCLANHFVLSGVHADLDELTAFAEAHVDAEDALLQNAIRTCLLEPLKDTPIEPLLGPRSRSYLKGTPFA